MNELSLVEVPFHGDVIEAVEDGRGVWVPLRRPCEALGLNPQAQQRRLERCGWAEGKTAVMAIQRTDGVAQMAFCVSLDGLPMWLATVEPSRVKEAVRPKLALYQKEAARVLAERFVRPPAPPGAALSAAQLALQMAQALVEQERRTAALEGRVGAIEESRERAALELQAVERSAEPPPPLTVRDKVNQLVRAYCRATGAEHGEAFGRLYRELFYRCDFNAQARARNSGRRAIDEVEAAGLMPELFAVASEVLTF